MTGLEIPFVPEPVHDFIDVEDFVDALLTIKEKGSFVGEIYEVGTGVQISNNEVRLLVEDVVGKKANIRPVRSMRKYDTVEWKADTFAIQNLGWNPRKSLRQSIEEMYEFKRESN